MSLLDGQRSQRRSPSDIDRTLWDMARESVHATLPATRRAGFIETPMTAVLNDEFKQAAVKQIPLGE